MQRVRIGITGLAVVFLIVLLAAAIVGFHSKEKPADGNGAMLAANAAEAPPTDPLAELGVAPGGTTGSDRAADSGNTAR